MKRVRGSGSVYRHGAAYWCKYYLNGKPIRENTHCKKEPDAKKFLKRRLGEIAVGRFISPQMEKVTLNELAEDIRADYKVNGKASSNDLELRLNHLLPVLGHIKAYGLGTDMIKKYVARRQEEKAANATINRELAALKRMFNLGIQAEKIYRKPYIPMLAENNVRKGFFEHAEFIALRGQFGAELQGVLTFAYYTGWRKNEILSLRWSQVDLNNQTVRLDPGTTKSGDGRTIILEGELLELIKQQWERRAVAKIPGQSPTVLCAYVFHRRGKPIKDFYDAWRKACTAAELEGRIFHDFRRTAVRNMVRAGVPERVAMMVSGHKTRSVFDRYDVVNEDDLKRAALKTWTHIQAQPTTQKVVAMSNRSV
jgi:integrase